MYLQRGALDNRPVENQQENQQEDQLQAHQQQAPPAHDQLRRADQWMLKPQYSGAMARQHIQLRQADQWKMRAQYSGGMARQHPVQRAPAQPDSVSVHTGRQMFGIQKNSLPSDS